jgi:hypothetical protein
VTRRQSRHVREADRKDSNLLCGGGRSSGESQHELRSVPALKWKPQKDDCGRCVKALHSIARIVRNLKLRMKNK